ncbi:MAG TPA: hypothetical protein VK929_13710, partial [Longimicrobiales bacterium]|nr:hypothetical protein [Longimicrobiales bacterium]
MIGPVRHSAEAILSATTVLAAVRRRAYGGVLVLAYHNIVPDGAVVSGDPSLHLRQSDFARQLDALMALCDVVPLDRVLERTTSLRPRAALTFDDGYRGALTVGAAELRARRLPATYFISPGLLGGSFWWDEVAGGATLPDSVRDHALGALRGRGRAVRAWALATGRAL